MTWISLKRNRFPADVIRQAVWLYFRFTPSFRDVEELLAQRGIEVSYETIRCWAIKFGPQIARNLRRREGLASPRWHLDEMVCRVGASGCIFGARSMTKVSFSISSCRPGATRARLKPLRRLLRSNPVPPEAILTDGLASYGAALKELNLAHRHRRGRLRENNRAENSHLPIRRRERKMQGFKSAPSAQRFLTTHAAIYNAFYVQRHLICRPTLRLFTARAMSSWRAATIAA